jgi:serine phosphatase RsbU (regulator of sigma subunit)
LKTDGIWETTNSEGYQLAKERFRDVVQANASDSAAEILTDVINEIERFACKSKKSDGITLVNIKIA